MKLKDWMQLQDLDELTLKFYAKYKDNMPPDVLAMFEEAERKFREQKPKPHRWDIRFMQMARLVSTWSKDPSTQAGAVIVRPDKSIASVGFNGFPKSMPDNPEWYTNREEKYSRIVHCEINALIHAHEQVTGCTLYTWPFACCERCSVIMIQAGITRFVYPELAQDKKERWEESLKKSRLYIAQCHAEATEIAIEDIP